MVPRVRPVLLVLRNLLLQRRDVVRQALLLHLVEDAYLSQLAVEERDEESVGVADVRPSMVSADEGCALIRFEVMVGFLEAGPLLLELVNVLLQSFVASRRRYSQMDST